MYVVSFIAGIAIAVGAALSLGGWRSGAETEVTANTRQMPVIHVPVSTADAPVVLLAVVDSEADVALTYRNVQLQYPLTEVTVVVMESAADLASVVSAPNDAQTGGRALVVRDLRTARSID